MNLFGLSFVLFILNWSAGKGFWYQLRVTDKPPLLRAIIAERSRKKVESLPNIYKSQTLNSHYKAWRYKKKKHKKTGNLFRENLQLKDVC